MLDCNVWRPDRASESKMPSKVVRIAHAPTRRVAKGTDILVKTVEDLRERGLPVELDLIENLSYDDMKEALLRCDIGVDQLLYGWYGKVSVELMALGKPVICFIDPVLGSQRPDLPIVRADSSSLASVLERLVEDQALRVSTGLQSLEYVKKYHDVDHVADQLLELYDSL